MREYNKRPDASAKKKAGLRRYYRENIDTRKSWDLQRAYGISKADYDRMLAAQGGVCATCKQPQAGSRRLAVDHCHMTGAVRGLLCTRCNYALGQARDNPALLRAMANYLERGRPVTD